MRIIPCSLRDANIYVSVWHRHSAPSVGHKFSCAVVNDEGVVIGAGIASLPRSRVMDDGETLEIIRISTNGYPNACSMLYAALRTAGKALGYTRIITYTLESENGASVRAAGFRKDGISSGGEWDSPYRSRKPQFTPTVPKIRYVWP